MIQDIKPINGVFMILVMAKSSSIDKNRLSIRILKIIYVAYENNNYVNVQHFRIHTSVTMRMPDMLSDASRLY